MMRKWKLTFGYFQELCQSKYDTATGKQYFVSSSDFLAIKARFPQIDETQKWDRDIHLEVSNPNHFLYPRCYFIGSEEDFIHFKLAHGEWLIDICEVV